MGVWYCSREDVKSALDSKESARNNSQIDREIESHSRGVESFLHRTFAPTLATRYFDWPNPQFGASYRVWLNQYEVISLSLVVSGGNTLTPSQYNLEPVNEGPPYNRIEIDLGASPGAGFSAGATYQQSLALTGLFGYTDDSAPCGALSAAISSTSATTCDVTDGSVVGVGSVIKIDNERMLVTERSMLDTGQTVTTGSLTQNSAANNSFSPTDATQLHIGEVILVGSERMLIVDIAGGLVTVKRAWDGTVLATHLTTDKVYALRHLTVSRAALGTTAATHSNSAPITFWVVPGPVRQLVIAEVLNTFEQESSGYARTIGSGDNVRNASGAGIEDVRNNTYTSHGRKARQRVA